jgi:PEP-CTERM motif
MKKAFRILLFGFVGAIAPAVASAAPITINFGTDGPTGNTNSSTFTDPGTGLKVTGYYLNSSNVWTPANLFRRDEDPNDVGFGVCNPIEGSSCGTGSGGGDINELDNSGQRELIRLTLPTGYTWVSVGVSSLDTNGGVGSPESGRLFADSNGIASTTAGASGDTLITSFTGSSNPNLQLTIPGGDASSPYLFFEPFNPNGSTNNDFLISNAVIQSTGKSGQGTVPEPATLVLLGSGLALAVRKRRALR